MKWRAYYRAGVGHYWLVDLANKRITVYERGERSYELVEILERAETHRLPPFEAVDFSADQVFLVAALVLPDPEEPDEAAEDAPEYGATE